MLEGKAFSHQGLFFSKENRNWPEEETIPRAGFPSDWLFLGRFCLTLGSPE